MKWVKVRAHSHLYAVASQDFKRVFLEMTFSNGRQIISGTTEPILKKPCWVLFIDMSCMTIYHN